MIFDAVGRSRSIPDIMPFGPAERARLLSVKGIGETVIARLEMLGFSTLEELADASAEEITRGVAQELGSSCWRNSPQARAAIHGAISAARAATETESGAV